jgi:GNAT superfamily N-acetyltransferase
MSRDGTSAGPPGDIGSGALTLRLATPDDVETLTAHRRLMWHDMGQRDPALLDDMCARFAPWVRTRMAAGDYRTWLAEDGSRIVAGAAAWERERHPPVTGRHPRYVYVLNVYTEPGYRLRGIARLLLDTIVEWARTAGHDTIDLTASAEGQPLYESLGFVKVNEMRLVL